MRRLLPTLTVLSFFAAISLWIVRVVTSSCCAALRGETSSGSGVAMESRCADGRVDARGMAGSRSSGLIYAGIVAAPRASNGLLVGLLKRGGQSL
jgi:hypothetical protein